MKSEELFLRLLRSALWGTPVDLKGQIWTHEQFSSVMTLARQQAVAGLISQALMASGVKLERQDALTLFAFQQGVRKRNAELDDAVVKLCEEMKERGIRIFVMKGQTLAALYPDAGLRQSGDIDFLCHPDDWNQAIHLFRDEKGLVFGEDITEKHTSFQIEGIEYELHRQLTAFTYPGHRRYWADVVMPEIWDNVSTIQINGQDVPTLSPTYNALYVFVHIFYHLIDEGIGLRQFCDWAVLLAKQGENESVKDGAFKAEIVVEVLERHLKGIGLLKAYHGLGAILTDYLGLPTELFPFMITEDDHKHAPKLFQNMLEMGNFGHNKQYIKNSGIIHGVQHLGRITMQARRFAHYAPAEAWWRLPYLINWWRIKILSIIRGKNEKREMRSEE